MFCHLRERKKLDETAQMGGELRLQFKTPPARLRGRYLRFAPHQRNRPTPWKRAKMQENPTIPERIPEQLELPIKFAPAKVRAWGLAGRAFLPAGFARQAP